MEDNRQVGLEVTDELIEQVSVKVEEKIAKKSNSTSPRMFSDPTLQDKFENAYKIWENNGYENVVDQYDATKRDQKIGYAELCDALSTPDASILIPKVISNIVKEAIEPLLVGTSLLQTIRFSAGQQITFPAAGAFTAEDIPEGGEYPERKLEVAGTVDKFAVFKSHLINWGTLRRKLWQSTARYLRNISAATTERWDTYLREATV